MENGFRILHLIAGGRFEPGKASAHNEGGVDALLDSHPLQSTQLA